jgi:hypothetical protein
MDKELSYPGSPIKRGASGKSVRLVQEWLCHHGFPTAIDSDFGAATATQIAAFQSARKLRSSKAGEVDSATYGALVLPMLEVLRPIDPTRLSYPQLVLAYARQHVQRHPIEIGGANAGPWVRLYMKGNEGADWLWCAGFVSFLLKQAADTLGAKPPLPYTFSCDTLALEAERLGLLVPGKQLKEGKLADGRMLPAAAIFLSRNAKATRDWIHTGIVARFDAETLQTCEGNTNDSGSREGFEAVARVRGYAGKDFIRLG